MFSILGPVKKKTATLPARFWIPALSGLALAAAWQSSPAQAQDLKPRVQILETSHDFGTVFLGEDVSHLFIVRNIGDAPLTLSEQKSLVSQVRFRPSRAEWTADSAIRVIAASVNRAAPT